MKVTLLLVRHGATAWNRQHRFQGQADPALSRAGLLQVRSLAAQLARWPVTAIHSSDLLRARQTATALAAPHGLPVQVDRRWREISFGAWEGLRWSEIVAVDEALVRAWRQNPEQQAPPGGETLAELRARLQTALSTLANRGFQVVVTHGGPLRVLLGRSLFPAGWAVVQLHR